MTSALYADFPNFDTYYFWAILLFIDKHHLDTLFNMPITSIVNENFGIFFAKILRRFLEDAFESFKLVPEFQFPASIQLNEKFPMKRAYPRWSGWERFFGEVDFSRIHAAFLADPFIFRKILSVKVIPLCIFILDERFSCKHRTWLSG